ncbi:nitroreductase family protein [Streptomyces sp. NPDC005989]|uniref:nitroreductase family protein n=1 Tax=Streptomyces sp. NPDC005989 TaxID=3156727 RepID=UPI0033C6BFC8
MDVYGAVDGRRAVRAFSDEPVSREVFERVLTAATRAPSSGNLQPWHVYVVAGEPLAELKRRATARALAGDPGDEREYPMYPAELASPYMDRFAAAAAQRYEVLGIERDDPDRPMKIAALNSEAFGAPLGPYPAKARTGQPPYRYLTRRGRRESQGDCRLVHEALHRDRRHSRTAVRRRTRPGLNGQQRPDAGRAGLGTGSRHHGTTIMHMTKLLTAGARTVR